MTATTAPTRTPLPLRNDTLLGVCEGLGEDFGINANWLRVAFVLPLFFQPVLTIAAYLLTGVGLAFARWIAPDKVVEQAPAALAAPVADARDEEEYRIAA